MPFQSFAYLCFFCTVFLLYHLAPQRWRVPLLIAASLWFYAELRQGHLLASLVATALASYGLGRLIQAAKAERVKRLLLWLGIAGNVSLLLYLRYLGFFASILNDVVYPFTSERVPVPPELVAIGVSYFVFQGISYLADVYLGRLEAEKHLPSFFLYMSFFPRLLQGPIERAGDLLPQLRRLGGFQYENVRLGMLLFAWGLFKKLVVADTLAPLVDGVFGNVANRSGIDLLVASYLYAIEIYCDFSGYTDMALGSARALNIELTQNFARPYSAPSVAEFWRRWHISFSRWILEYIFKPLQMAWRDWGALGAPAALLVTFLICGLWHGPSWTFVVWGLLHGLYLAVGTLTRPWSKKIHQRLGTRNNVVLRIWRPVLTFHLVCLAWIFFRARSLGDAWHVVTHVFPLHLDELTLITPTVNLKTVITLAPIVVVLLVEYAWRGSPRGARLFTWPVWVRWPMYYALALAIIVLRPTTPSQSFLYFQF